MKARYATTTRCESSEMFPFVTIVTEKLKSVIYCIFAPLGVPHKSFFLVVKLKIIST